MEIIIIPKRTDTKKTIDRMIENIIRDEYEEDVFIDENVNYGKITTGVVKIVIIGIRYEIRTASEYGFESAVVSNIRDIETARREAASFPNRYIVRIEEGVESVVE